MPKLERQEQEIDAQIGERIRLRRTELGISQAELADRIGMSFQQIQKYERGANRIASSILLRVAQALHSAPGHFLELPARRNKKTSALAETSSDKKIAQLFQRLRHVTPAKARIRIMNALDGLLREAETLTPASKRGKMQPRARSAAVKAKGESSKTR